MRKRYSAVVRGGLAGVYDNSKGVLIAKYLGLYAARKIRTALNRQEEVNAGCEWTQPGKDMDSFPSTRWFGECRKGLSVQVSPEHWWKYCPYCGRKVKISE